MRTSDLLRRQNFKLFKDFVSRNYRIDHPMTSKKFLDWFAGGSRGYEISNIFDLENKKLIAILFRKKFLSRIRGKKTSTFWLSHWIVDRRYRGIAGLVIIKKFLDLSKLYFTINPSETAIEIYKLFKWKLCSNFTRYLFFLDTNAVNKFSLRKVKNKLFNISYHNKQNYRKTKLLIKERVTSKNYDVKNYKIFNNAVLRTSEFIKWRYINHPFFKYKVFLLGSSKVETAVAIFRISKTAFMSKKIKIAIINDFYFPLNSKGEENADILLEFLKIYFAKKKCAFIQFYCTSLYLRKIFIKNDFIIENTKFPIIPTNFDPINKKHKILKFMHSGEKKLKQIKKEKFYITLGDLDGDNPVRL